MRRLSKNPTQAADKIRALASMDASAAAPYFHAACRGLVPRPCPGLKTWAVTSKGVLLYDPETTVEWSRKYGRKALAGLYLHESLHWVCGHGLRRGERDPDDWNIAGDLWINQVVLDIRGLELPSCGVMVEDYVTKDGQPFPRGRTADEYYDLLQGAELSASGQAKAARNEGGDPLPAAGKCGGGAGNELEGELAAEAEARAAGEDAYNKSSMAGQSLATQLATAKQVAKELKTQCPGSMPGGMDRWVDEQLTPTPIPWPTTMGRTLRAWATKAGCGGRTFSIPSRLSACLRRPGSRSVLMPTRVKRRIKWMMIIDTSGSMDTDNVSRGVAYAKQLVQRPGVELWVGSCDTDVTPPTKARTTAEMMSAIKGGGGTDFRPIFEFIESMDAHDRPDFVCIYTDGFGPAPARAPDGVDVLWVLSSSYGEPAEPASWGTKIRLEQL